jgi:hypothetical protein
METISKNCGWSGCETVVDKINPKTEKPFYYCAEHTDARKVHKQKYYQENKNKHNAACMERYYSLRNKALEMYGNKCACCKEEQEVFLALDHINGGGRQHRRERGGSYGVYKDAIEANDPKRFRVLCHNCNMAYHISGICPHQLAN